MTHPDTLTLCPRGCGHALWEPRPGIWTCVHHGIVEEPGVVYVRQQDLISSSPRVIAATRALEADAPGPATTKTKAE